MVVLLCLVCPTASELCLLTLMIIVSALRQLYQLAGWARGKPAIPIISAGECASPLRGRLIERA